MNKILVTNNEISVIDGNVRIEGKKIYFKENGDYEIEYNDCNDVELEFRIDSGTMIKLFEYSDNDEIRVKNKYFLQEHSNLLVFKFYNNKKCREEIVFNLDGEYAKVNYHFSNICRDTEEYKIIINHNKLHTYSNISNRSIAIEGRTDFTIDSILPKKSIGCVLNQDTKIINLGENHSTIRPNMYIDLNDVEARHGSVIGRFNDEEIFYLMSRGIDYNNSIKLLVRGYIFSNLVMDMDSMTKITNIINKYWG